MIQPFSFCRFQPIFVEEPTVEDTISILRGIKARYEAHHGVRILDSAVVDAARLSARYLSGRKLPDKAIDLIDEVSNNRPLFVQFSPVEILEVNG